MRVLASPTVVTDPSFESTAASALVAELVEFAAHCRLDYAASLVAESASVCPPSVGGACALSMDVLEDRQEEFQCFAAALPHLVSTLLAPEGDPDAPDIPTPRSYAEAIEGPYSSQWQAAMDAEMASWKSTGTYVDEVPPPGVNIGVDYFQTFSPTPKMTTLRVLLHIAAQRDYELHSLDFSTAFLQGSLHEEIWLRRPPGFTGSFPAGTRWSLQRPVYGLRQAPHEWHDTLRTTLAALGFAPSTADPSLFLRTDTLLPPFYILVYDDDLVFATADTAGLAHMKSELQKRHTCTDLGELCSYLGLQITRERARRTITLTQSHMVQQVLQRFDFTYSSPQATPLSTRHSLSALPSDESVEPSGPYPELVGCLMYLMTCTRPDLAYPLSILTRYVAPGRHRPVHMAAAKRVLRYLCSTSGLGLVLGGRSPVVLTGHADASWVDDLATQRSSQGYTFSLGSGSVSWRSTRSSSVLSSSCEAEIYAGAMAALELEHRTKHIALRYFLARELQQRGQLRLAYVASQANTADIFTKALQPCDHQRFCTMLGLRPSRCPARSTPRALPCPELCPLAALPCSPCAALPCSPRALPCSPRAAPPCGPPAGRASCARTRGAGARVARTRRHETLSSQQLREWAVRWGNPGGGACGATTGGTCEFTPTGSAVGGRGGSRGGQKWQQRPPETLSPQQLREWVVRWGSPGGGAWGTSAGGGEAPGGVEATSLGACDPASTGAESEEALHTFLLDSEASRCFFRDCTTVTPLTVLVPVTLADPSGGPVVAHSSTVLPCPPGGELVAICTDSRTGEHLATFTRRPGSGLYTLTAESAQVAESGQVAASVEVAASCSCRLLTHQTLLWHHHLGHPSLPRLNGMYSRLLVSDLPRSLPPLRRSLAPPCLPCVEGRQRAAPHSSSFPPTTAPLQTLHMDVWGPARVTG
ncbi:unnamed protein product [Closterium sp. NIES-54]